ncbi:MAG: PilZ domain-containing protein [Elusimicrobiota bacterium]
MSKEKRKHKRLPTTIIADIYDAATLELKGKGCIFDLSKSGIALETNLKLDKTKPFFIRMNIPMEILCRIIRSESEDAQTGVYRYGLKYSRIKMSDAIKLKKIVFEDSEKC